MGMNTAAPNDHKRRMNVLVVDDNHDYADSLCQFLHLSEGWDVAAAYGVAHAISSARNRCPDAVLLDLEMPPASGFDLANAFEGSFSDRFPAIFAVSGSAALIERARADPRFRNTVLKPADPALLVKWLTEVAAHRLS